MLTLDYNRFFCISGLQELSEHKLLHDPHAALADEVKRMVLNFHDIDDIKTGLDSDHIFAPEGAALRYSGGTVELHDEHVRLNTFDVLNRPKYHPAQHAFGRPTENTVLRNTAHGAANIRRMQLKFHRSIRAPFIPAGVKSRGISSKYLTGHSASIRQNIMERAKKEETTKKDKNYIPYYKRIEMGVERERVNFEKTVDMYLNPENVRFIEQFHAWQKDRRRLLVHWAYNVSMRAHYNPIANEFYKEKAIEYHGSDRSGAATGGLRFDAVPGVGTYAYGSVFVRPQFDSQMIPTYIKPAFNSHWIGGPGSPWAKEKADAKKYMMLRRYDRSFVLECEPHVVTIQRVFRGYNARAHEIEKRRKEKFALKYIVRFMRRKYGLFGGAANLRGESMATVVLAHTRAEKQRKAATKIQKVARGRDERTNVI